MFGFESVKLLGIDTFGQLNNGEVGYEDKNGWVQYEPSYFECSLFKVANGTVFINLPRRFLSQNPPDYLYFCIDTDTNMLYLSFLEPRPEVPAYPRALQKAGKNNCQVRLPFPRELKGHYFPDNYHRMTLTEIAKNLYKCDFEWKRMEPVQWESKQKPIYDGD